jgi:hypothetical protein
MYVARVGDSVYVSDIHSAAACAGTRRP